MQKHISQQHKKGMRYLYLYSKTGIDDLKVGRRGTCVVYNEHMDGVRGGAAEVLVNDSPQ